jgi:hypothetical protein
MSNPHPVKNHRRPRADSRFKDEGCPLHPACLECPEEACVLDDGAPVFGGQRVSPETTSEKVKPCRRPSP